LDEPSYLYQFILLSFIKPISIETIISFLTLVVLLLFSALISGSEVAFFSLNPNEKEKLNNSESKVDQTIITMLNAPKKLLATILIANNFVNIAIILLSTFIANNIFDFSNTSTWISFGVQIIGITFVLLLFGEVIPKVYATKNALKLAYVTAFPLSILEKIFRPISFLLISSTNIIDKKVKRKSHDISVEELSHALDLTDDISEDEDEHKILKGIIKFGETSVKQIMKARVDVVALEKSTPYHEVLETILNCGFSRIPIIDGSFDKIIGLLYIKDLLAHIHEKENFEWNTLLRNPFFIPENKKLDDLLKEFQNKKIHLAVVVDEYGGTSGIITLEDVLEEIVGEISDEFDDDDIIYSKLDENNYTFDGKTSLNDVCKILKIDNSKVFDDIRKEADSIAGLVIEIAGKIPKKNEIIKHNNFTFVVEAADKRRIKRVKLTKDLKNED